MSEGFRGYNAEAASDVRREPDQVTEEVFLDPGEALKLMEEAQKRKGSELTAQELADLFNKAREEKQKQVSDQGAGLAKETASEREKSDKMSFVFKLGWGPLYVVQFAQLIRLAYKHKLDGVKIERISDGEEMRADFHGDEENLKRAKPEIEAFIKRNSK